MIQQLSTHTQTIHRRQTNLRYNHELYSIDITIDMYVRNVVRISSISITKMYKESAVAKCSELPAIAKF
jgi:hypothetical protein